MKKPKTFIGSFGSLQTVENFESDKTDKIIPDVRPKWQNPNFNFSQSCHALYRRDQMFLGRSAKPRTKLQILNKFIAVFKSDRFGHSPPPLLHLLLLLLLLLFLLQAMLKKVEKILDVKGA